MLVGLLQNCNLVQDFLDGSSSQLTHHGLASLREGLRSNELAVFFRNNHFNTIFLHKNVVHILVTDQGYEFEKVGTITSSSVHISSSYGVTVNMLKLVATSGLALACCGA